MFRACLTIEITYIKILRDQKRALRGQRSDKLLEK